MTACGLIVMGGMVVRPSLANTAPEHRCRRCMAALEARWAIDQRRLGNLRTAYSKGWEDACSLAIVRFNSMAEVAFSAGEAIEELQLIAEATSPDA